MEWALYNVQIISDKLDLSDYETLRTRQKVRICNRMINQDSDTAAINTSILSHPFSIQSLLFLCTVLRVYDASCCEPKHFYFRMGKKVKNVSVSQVLHNSVKKRRLGPVLLDFHHAPCDTKNFCAGKVQYLTPVLRNQNRNFLP